MTCPAVVEVITPGPPGPPGSAVVLTGPAVLGRAQTTSGAATALPLGAGLSIVDGALTATGATNLSYDPATRLLSSSTGADVTLPLVSTTAAGLVPSGWLTGAEAAILPNIHGALAGPVYEHVRNVSGATMAALTPYHVVGSQGNTDRVQIIPADASNPASMPASGILTTALANNEDGHGVIAGVPTGLDTVANPSGTTLYVGSGVLTATAPASNIQAIAVVGRSHASTGSLAVAIGPALGNAALRNVGTTAGTVAAGDAPAAAVTAHVGTADPHPILRYPTCITLAASAGVYAIDVTTTAGAKLNLGTITGSVTINLANGSTAVTSSVPANIPVSTMWEAFIEFVATSTTAITFFTANTGITLRRDTPAPSFVTGKTYRMMIDHERGATVAVVTQVGESQ